MVLVRRIIFRTQNRAKPLAGASVNYAQKLPLLARSPVPIIPHADPPPVGQHKAGYIDRFCT